MSVLEKVRGYFRGKPEPKFETDVRLLERLKVVNAAADEEALRKIHTLVLKDVDGMSTREDAVALRELLRETNISNADLAGIVRLLKEDRRLGLEREPLAQANADELAAVKALQEYDAETERIFAERWKNREAPHATWRDANSRAFKAQRAQDALEKLRWEHRALFADLSKLDLDLFTLHCGPDTIGTYDPNAPRLGVDRETLHREHHKRGRILAALRAKSHALFSHALQRYWQEASEKCQGFPSSDIPGPEGVDPLYLKAKRAEPQYGPELSWADALPWAKSFRIVEQWDSIGYAGPETIIPPELRWSDKEPWRLSPPAPAPEGNARRA